MELQRIEDLRYRLAAVLTGPDMPVSAARQRLDAWLSGAGGHVEGSRFSLGRRRQLCVGSISIRRQPKKKPGRDRIVMACEEAVVKVMKRLAFPTSALTTAQYRRCL